MRILLENSSNNFDNHGDTAMLVVAYRRLCELWPRAQIEVITSRPDELTIHLPEASPISWRYAPMWSGIRRSMYRWVPDIAARLVSVFEAEFKRRYPSRHRRLLNEAIKRVDLVIHSGAGVLTDEFYPEAFRRLDLVDHARLAGKPVALFGQGIGPLTRGRLVRRASVVLPEVDLISVREGRSSYPLLLSLGVDAQRVTVTGDDAIELAHAMRPARVGHDIGVSIRLASYSGLPAAEGPILEHLRGSLQAASRQLKVALRSIPTARSDVRSSRALVQLQADETEENEAFHSFSQSLEHISQCRIVVTGSYHAAVFALSQGIPAICLAKSAYYVQKFLGLSTQFGEGCTVLQLGTGDDRFTQLEDVLSVWWQMAEQFRPNLLAAAERQIESSRAAYRRFHDLVNAKPATETNLPRS